MSEVTHPYDATLCAFCAKKEAATLKSKSELLRDEGSADQRRAITKAPEKRLTWSEKRHQDMKKKFSQPKEGYDG